MAVRWRRHLTCKRDALASTADGLEESLKILSINPGHDGAFVFLADGILVFSLEAEKDSLPRFSELNSKVLLEALELVPSVPDIIAVGGWHEYLPGFYSKSRSSYLGLERGTFRQTRILGVDVQMFSSSHERSHLFMTAGMYPEAPLKDCVILVWEGGIGAFYRWADFGADIRRYHVMSDPGAKYAAVFALADPTFTTGQTYPRLEDAGKMMALAAYGRELECPSGDRVVIQQILQEANLYPFQKGRYSEAALFNCGLDTPRFWAAANHASDQIFNTFETAAHELFRDSDLPLLISGGCGLNCDWNERWRRSGTFPEVFVPPCANDSGSALGTAIDAMVQAGSPCRIDWSVFSGPDFCDDQQPDPGAWRFRALDYAQLATLLAQGEIVAWVQGRCEMGPRALGHRSLLANPCDPTMRTRLNAMKGRESYRPIAPCCRSEDLDRWFEMTRADAYMLYFAHVRSQGLPAITHIDGTARVQSVSRHDNSRLHQLLEIFERQTGFGVLCNTSLNFSGRGFINRVSDLTTYCDDRSISVFVIDDRMYTRAEGR